MKSGKITIEVRPRKAFRAYLEHSQRFACLVAHRRGGKTYGAIQRLLMRAIQKERAGAAPPRYGYLAPTRDQAKDIAWNYLKTFTKPIPGVVVNEADLRITLPKKQTIRLYSGENYERMRGLYFDGVLIDEPADIDPKAWSTVVRPCLSDYQGWADFIGTPKGKNAFYKRHLHARDNPEEWYSLLLKASVSGILPDHEIRSLRMDMTEDEYAQEYECDFNIGRPGAIYAADYTAAVKAGRVFPFPVDRSVPVWTTWDLGSPSNTVVCYWQRIGFTHRLIDVDHHLAVASGQPMKTGERVAHMLGKGYAFGGHLLPHDSRAEDYDAMSVRSRLEEAGLKNVQVIPRAGTHAEEKRVQVMLDLFPSIYFNEENVNDEGGFAEAIENYHRKESRKDGWITNVIEHDWTSHFADAFGYYGEGLKLGMIPAGADSGMPQVRQRKTSVRNSPSR